MSKTSGHIIAKKYTDIIYHLKKKYEKTGLRKGTELRTTLDSFQKWLITPANPMIPTQTHFLIGINLLRELIDQLESDKNEVITQLAECDLEECSPSDKERYLSLVSDYNQFSQDLIGCTDKGFTTILKLLRKSNLSQDAREYLEKECIELGRELEWVKSK